MTVLAETVQAKKHTLFVRLGVIRTDGRGGNVTPKVVIRFGRPEGAAESSQSTNKKEELWEFQETLACGFVKIGVWCNGGTTGSGSVSEGSNPSTPAMVRHLSWFSSTCLIHKMLCVQPAP